MVRKCTVLILLLVSVAAFSQVRQRRPVYFGFGGGTFFDAAWETDGVEMTWDDFYAGAVTVSPKVCINLKLGVTLSPGVLLGFDGTAIREEGNDLFTKISTQINNYFAMLTIFPMREGLFVRLGGGLSNFQLEVDDSFLGQIGEQYNGYGALAGVGYAFWLGKRFNLTLNLDHSRQFYSDAYGPDASRFTTFYVAFDWY